ncbi:MAG: BtrH N-terminal domain-containing protein [Halioglobus sp.]|nr:BtrH N-terminal domain-containing protein [Halioglobus sp.]
MTTFEHRQAAHCESGVMSSLLTHKGLPISEPMAFGLASALTFAYLPFIRISGMPLIGYRMPPRHIIRRLRKRLGLGLETRTFRDPDKGMAALDELLARGEVVGLQTSVYWLPYFPETMRFHFNAHNLLVYGREGDEYLISDPVFEAPVRCPAAALRKARFARGALAAKGLMYRITHMPRDYDREKATRAAIRDNRRYMTGAPLPIVGIRGIRYLGRTLEKLAADPARREQQLPHYLSHVVRMQEEIGTGGAGFRFMYASFLRESSRALGHEQLAAAAERMAQAGDQWRRFALLCSKICTGRKSMESGSLAAQLEECARLELSAWDLLKGY